MKNKLVQTQVQKQILAPTMQQSIEVLMLPILELQLEIEQKLQENPLLEVDEEVLKEQDHQIDAELRAKMERILEARSIPSNWNQEIDEDYVEQPVRAQTSLEENLLQQLRLETSDPEMLEIGEMIIGNLDEDGYLTVTIREIQETTRFHDAALIERVLNIIQRFEPVGIASRNLQECLMVQAEYKLNGESRLVSQLIKDYLVEVSQKRYTSIARRLKTSPYEVKKAAQIISALEPRPARNYRPVKPGIYIKPDVIVTQTEDGEYVIHMNHEGVPPLRISRTYRDMLKRVKLNLYEKEFIQEHLKSALLFIKSVGLRGQTMRNIAEYILKEQRDFFDKGYMHLKPMSLKDVARALERNESTISRAIHNKYLDSPQGIYPLKFFFSQAVGGGAHENGNISNRSIKEEIRSLIEEEDKQSPLSDQDIQQYFEKKGMKIARRTISKYRQNLKILPSHLRKEQ